MLLPSITLKEQSPVEFNFVLGIDLILSALNIENGPIEKNVWETHPSNIEKAEESLVLIYVQNSWASGVMISSNGCNYSIIIVYKN